MQKGQRNEYQVKTGYRPEKRLLAWGLSQPTTPSPNKKKKEKQEKKTDKESSHIGKK